MTESAWTVEVELTDRSRHADRTFVVFRTTVEVSADTETEARLVAEQMAGAIRHDLDAMVLGSRVLEVVL
jgi:hypothetical protein